MVVLVFTKNSFKKVKNSIQKEQLDIWTSNNVFS